MRPMLPALALGLLALSALPAAAASGGEVASDAPVVLDGAIDLNSAGLELLHRSFQDGSLDGMVYGGRLIDRQFLYLPFGRQEPECDQFNDRSQDEILLTVSKTIEGVRVRAKAGALLRIVPAAQLNLTGNDSFAVGPNPYAYEDQQLPAPGEPHAQYAKAFPQGAFALVPQGNVLIAQGSSLELEWGILEVVRGESVRAYQAGTFDERRSVPANNPLPTGPQTIECEVRVIHRYLFDQDRPVLTIRQGDLSGIGAFWNGEPNGRVTGAETTPEGYWERSRAAEYAAAAESLHLPSTLLAGPDFPLSINGTALFADALGSVQLKDGLHEVRDQSLTLTGHFTLTPLVSPDGQRMTMRVGDGVESFAVGDNTPSEWDQYQPYAWGAAGGIAVLGAAYWSWPAMKFGFAKLLLFPLYARLKKEDILENPLRDDILGVVETTPGISASELGRRMSCGWGTLVYHLTVLEKMQLVSSAREGRHKRFFVQGRINYSDKGAVGLLANPSARVILDIVRESPGLIQRDIGRRLGLSAGTIAWHMERLEEGGLVTRSEEGRVVRYYPTQRLIDLSSQVPPAAAAA